MQRIEYADMNMRSEPLSLDETYKELQALWIKQGRRTGTTPRQSQASRAAGKPVAFPNRLKGLPLTPRERQIQIQLDLKRKRLALLRLS